MKKLSVFLFLIFVSISSFAAERSNSYCKDYNLGWHFYCDERKSDDEAQLPENQDDYKEKLAEIKQTLEEKKAKAVIYPTEDNLRDYMLYQKFVLDKSSKFADVWRRTIWKTPELDYTLFRPTSKMGKESWVDQRNKNISETIQTINERYGVFFIYMGSCPYCHKYSPILKAFQQKYGITIMPVSMDGGSLPDWPESVVNKGQVERMGLETASVPATILFDKETKQFIPIGYGVLSHSELEERIYAITRLEVGNDF